MGLLLDSSWRALAYCLQWRVIAWSLLPLLLLLGISVSLLWGYGDAALLALQTWLSDWALTESLSRWLGSVGLGNLRTVLVPLLLLLMLLPVVIVLTLLAVAWLVTPAMVRLVARRRFAGLEQRHGGGFLGSLGQGLLSVLLALLALILTLPLWLIPPLALVLPPLIWGWLTARVMTYDVLALHATAQEREELMRRHRYPLLFMGVVVGYLGSAPGLIWAAGALAVVFAPLLIPLAIWIYTFVFIFAALWFSHYSLSALATLRSQPVVAEVASQELLSGTPHV